MGEDSGEKTEEPTPHKLREARKKGQVAKSKDLTSALLVIVSFYTLKASSEYLWDNMVKVMHMSFEYMGTAFQPTVAGHLLQNVLTIFLTSLAPLFAANVLVAVLSGGPRSQYPASH